MRQRPLGLSRVRREFAFAIKAESVNWHLAKAQVKLSKSVAKAGFAKPISKPLLTPFLKPHIFHTPP